MIIFDLTNGIFKYWCRFEFCYFNYAVHTKLIIDAAKFESEPRFENNLNKIKDNHLKSITSIAMNISDITSKKTLHLLNI